jgi:anti-sigma B factor antagonist
MRSWSVVKKIEMASIEFKRVGSYFVLSPKGDIDLYNVSFFKKELFKIIDKENTRVAVDLKDVSYMDSSGIGALVAGHKKLKNKGGTFVIYNINDDILNIVKLATLDRFFNIKDTEEELDQ